MLEIEKRHRMEYQEKIQKNGKIWLLFDEILNLKGKIYEWIKFDGFQLSQLAFRLCNFYDVLTIGLY